MTEPTTTFEQDLNALELTMKRNSYRACVHDMETILRQSLKDAKTPEEILLLLKIQTEMYSIEEVRFPKANTEN